MKIGLTVYSVLNLSFFFSALFGSIGFDFFLLEKQG